MGKIILSRIILNSKYFLIILLIRLISVVIVRGYFVPDEYWQSLEVSHKLVFGYGHLTWEWQHGLRNWIYPLFFAFVYKLLQLLSLDSALALIYIPRILQAILVSYGDYSTFKLANKLFGSEAAKWTLFCTCTSWFIFYCGSRTLINSTEMALTAIGLSIYPLNTSNSSGYLWIAALNCAMRPTAVIIWIPLYFRHLFKAKLKLLIKTILIGLISICLMLIIDSWCYAKFTITPLNFFIFNWSKSIGTFYGSHNWHWYISQGLPVVLNLHLIPFIIGLRKKYLWPVYLIILWFIFVLSQLEHKEFRFLLPLMPLIMCVCGESISKLPRLKLQMATLIVMVNLPVAFYFGLVHQTGVINAMGFVRDEIIERFELNVLFLMPCHSTPYYSHLHSNITMRFLTCEPNLYRDEKYVDEADRFYDSPTVWIKRHVAVETNYVVAFDSIEFNSVHFKQCFKTFHTHFPTGRIGRNVVVYCRRRRKY